MAGPRTTIATDASRDVGLDAFRGLTVLLMVIVNLQGNDAGFAQLRHAAWDGMTLADFVFPWFILAVGLSVPLALDGRGRVAWRHVLRRLAMLVGIGVALGWLLRPTLDLDAIRWVGVLQRIAIVYLACVIVAARSVGIAGPAAVAAVCLAAHTIAILTIAAPGEATPSLDAGQGLSGWLDRLLPGRLYRPGWDPEGVLSTLPAIGTGLVGVAATRSLRAMRRARVALAPVGLVAIGLVAIGLAATPFLPLNKSLWTASYACVAAGTGLLVWQMLARAAATRVGRRLLSLPVLAGRTALTLYVVHMLVVVVLVRKVGGERLWARGDAAFGQVIAPDSVASLAFALVGLALSLAPLGWLRRRGLLIRA